MVGEIVEGETGTGIGSMLGVGFGAIAKGRGLGLGTGAGVGDGVICGVGCGVIGAVGSVDSVGSIGSVGSGDAMVLGWRLETAGFNGVIGVGDGINVGSDHRSTAIH